MKKAIAAVITTLALAGAIAAAVPGMSHNGAPAHVAAMSHNPAPGMSHN